ncbi:reverse transcriptase (RNA-dependent DNA polymerase) [Hirsutella rhossiliensis]|uniref:Reverse transcriptase (RNA-dependent DNA polymerase) domain-containing protein n=1 Tax=Hirsutella rhossiliensis TaxID=111463 RepID=A0A9P8SPB5_9HYPO|nr:reverse transcriptase (RNA-dependent DNA polymerase) domain-containing protein [Hirsutella rhossiliensis]KAH0968765.1 reverse transcriptase (RNA-dependent DNA polymerase) domain-containing protein [Hirsutella rhossiliensis]
MTYVRRRPGLMVDQRRPTATRDILWLVVNDITLVNIYRQPSYDEALDILLRWPAPDRCLVAGDFNAKHHSWQAGRIEGRGEAVAAWATANGLNLLNPADVPTNPHGNTIDLAFSNIALAAAVVEDHLATSSDHFTLNITLPELAVTPPPTGKVRLTSDEEIRRFIEMVENGVAAIQPSTASPQDLDSLALAVTNLFQFAAKAAGRPVRKGARSAPWWTEECVLAAAEYRAVRRVFPLGFCREVQLAKKTFRRVVRRVKRRYWRDLIDSFTDSASVFRAVLDDAVYETQLDKANALRRATLERRTSQDDITDPWVPVDPVRDATLRTGNTSPGSDNITVKMLRAVWHAIGNLVHKLYQGCLNIGHHPKPFRKRKWSAVDLVAALVHDIEEAFARKQVATLVTMDIEGAFDTVLRNRLILRLRQQGWPSNVARWAGSFMHDRTACIRYQDVTTPSSPLQCGLPQGSPASPILFLLYTEPVYRLSSPKGRFGYADDTAILCVGNNLEETARKASRHVHELMEWGTENAIAFDPKKTEVMHFSRTKPRTAPPVFHGEMEKRPECAMRWLGIWLDSTLSFKTHVEKWTAKAQRVAHHLQGMTNTNRGPLPSAVRRAVRACIEPQLLFGAEAWYPGMTSPRWTQPMRQARAPSTQIRQRPALQTAPKEESAANFRDWLRGAAGYGYAIHLDGLTVLDGNGRLGPAEVFDAEAKGALEGLRAALGLPGPERIAVCLDNLAVASCLRGMPSDSSQNEFLEFQALAAEHGATEIRWIPGHTNIPGNEQADALAKAGTSQPEPVDALPTLAYLRKVARRRPKDAFKAWWEVSAPQQYKVLDLDATTGCPPELTIPRPLLHHLLAARTHHGDFADYHERFNHDDARLTCSSDEAGALTDRGGQPSNRKKFRPAEQRSAFEPMKCWMVDCQRSALASAAAMASATSSHASSDPFDLGAHTPPNLARLARASQLRNSSPIVTRPIGLSSAFRRPAATPSSPLIRLSNAAATEGARREPVPSLPGTTETDVLQPVSIIDAANKLAGDETDAHNAKMTVFRAFCESFEQTAKQFTSGLEHSFAEHFSNRFLDLWRQTPSDLRLASAPTYSSVAAGRTASQRPCGHSPTAAAAPQQEPQQPISRLQGRPIPAPPKEDLRVFVRLPAEAPARDHNSYAIRTHIAAKVGIDLHQVPAAFKVNSGWAIRTTDATIRDLIVQRQSEWSQDMGATDVEISQRWYTYAVANCPYILTDLQGKNWTTSQPPKMKSPARPASNPSGRLAQYIERSSLPSQCDKCWDFHARHTCDRQASCKRCGRRGHDAEACVALERCANCLGPHAADFAKCPARPKRSHGVIRRLTREEKSRVRELGAQLSARRKEQYERVERSEQPERDATCSPGGVTEKTVTPGPDRKTASESTHLTPRPQVLPGTTDSKPNLMTKPHGATLRVFQANVGKISPAHDCALALADSEHYDVVLLQEPWTETKGGRCLTKTHPAYDTFSPVDSWEDNSTRPRVMTYVRRRPGLMVDQRRPAATRDILWLTVNDITLVNVYRQPCLVAGDFNAKHHSWQAGRIEGRGEAVAAWATANGLNLLNPADVPTNPRGNTIDLAFSNIALANAVVEDHLATSSDHFTLSTTLPELAVAPPPTGKFAAKAAGRPVRKGARSAPWWTEECSLAAVEYRARVVRRVKRRYWRDLIDSFTDSASVFKAVLDDTVYETQLDKANALRRATLERRTSQDDITDPWVPVDTARTIPFAQNVSLEEVRDATLRTGNTSPGSDNITVKMLRAVWHTIGSLVHKLYQGCLDIGHHPKPFREAEVVMITKPGRRNLSAVDLVAALVHDIEEAFSRKQVATLVTMDVEGAFDTVLRSRLILRLRQQGWPRNVARSPASPILFLLYTEPIYRLSNPKGRFGYADDTAVLCVGDSLEETAHRASKHVHELMTWGTANAITFDPKKTEVMHFSRTTPRNAPPVFHGEVEKRPGSAMRWLGIWLDSTLTFKTHVEKWTAKAQAVAYHLKGLTIPTAAPTRCGPRAVRACIEPQLFFGAEAWYPGMTCPRWNKPAKEGPSRIRHLIRRMDKSLNTAMRAILPVWKTTPLSARHREAGIPPVSHLLQACRTRFAARLKSSTKRTRLRVHDNLSGPDCVALTSCSQGAPGQTFSHNRRQTSASGSNQLLHGQQSSTRTDPLPEGAAGYGYAVHQDGLTVLSGNGRLGLAEVFDAEARGSLEGLRAALSLPAADQIVVCLDNLAVATCLQGMPSDSSQKEFLEFQALAAEHGATEIRWIPGHTNIPGSDQKTHSKPGGKFLHPNKPTTGTSLITTKG